MRIVLGTHSFRGIGGSETYLLTAAEHLQRLGHDVTIHAVEGGGRQRAADQEKSVPTVLLPLRFGQSHELAPSSNILQRGESGADLTLSASSRLESL